MDKEEREINALDILKAMKKRWLLILEIVLVCTIISVVYNFFIADPVYKTSTKLFIGKDVISEGSEYDSNEVNMYQKLMQTYAGFATSSDLIERALSNIDIGLTVSVVKENFSVEAGENDLFLTFHYESENIDEGVKVLEAITDEFIEFSKQQIANGNVVTVESPKYPTEPSSPNKVRNVIVSIVLGLVIAIGLTFIIEYLDNTVKSKSDIEKLLGVPVLGIVPEEDEGTKKFNKKKKERVVG